MSMYVNGDMVLPCRAFKGPGLLAIRDNSLVFREGPFVLETGVQGDARRSPPFRPLTGALIGQYNAVLLANPPPYVSEWYSGTCSTGTGYACLLNSLLLTVPVVLFKGASSRIAVHW